VHVLQDVEGVSFAEFGQADVVRHELVQRIVRAYASFEGEQGRATVRPRVEDGDGERRR
jgi:phosphate starvation-inducible PhoH-like protein